MMELALFQIVEFGASFVEAMTGILVNAKALGTKVPKFRSIVTASFVITIVIWGINQYQLFTVAATVAGIIGIAVAACVICRIRIFDALVLSAFYLLLIYSIDFLSMALLGVVLQKKEIAEYLTADFSLIRVFYVVFSKGLLLAVYSILSKIILFRIHVPIWKMWMGIMLGFGIVYYFVICTFSGVNAETFFMWFLMLALMLLGLYSVIQYVSFVQEKTQMKLAEERNAFISEHYESIIKNYRDKQIFYHDLKNQYVIIGNYMKHKEYEKAKEYMEKLEIPFHGSMLMSNTGIDTLDILVDYKGREAKDRGIQVDIVAEPISIKLTEQETTALLGNLLDNAIDACMKVDEEDRWIRIVFKKIQEMTFIKVSNSCKERPQEREGVFLSLKKEGIHGLGMASVKMIVDKYQGSMNIEAGEKSFTILISFFC